MLFVCIVAMSCEKEEPPLDFNSNWYIEALSPVQVFFHIDRNGSKVSHFYLKNGEKKTISKSDYIKLEIQCTSGNCSYKLNNEPWNVSKVFD